MKRCTTLSFLLIVLSVVFASCNGNTSKKKIDTAIRAEIEKVILSYRNKLPFKYEGTDISIIDVNLDKDVFVYKVAMPLTLWEEQGLSETDANSDKNIARILSNFDSNITDKLVDAGLGFKYIYTCEDNDSVFAVLDMSPEKIADIKDKLAKGTIEPWSIAEIAQLELNKMQLPIQIDEGVWLTDAEIKNGNIYYYAMIEAELDDSDVDSDMLAEMKNEIVLGLREERMFVLNKKSILRDKMHIIYVYKDNRGKKFATIDIAPTEMFND